MTELELHGAELIKKGYAVVPIKQGKKYPAGLDGWQKLTLTIDDLENYCSSHTGAGILARDTPGVDLDIYDEAFSLEMAVWCQANIGPAPCRVGFPPKRLLAYRTSAPFKKREALFTDQAGKDHKIEILGDGQQWVAFHIHPDTGKPYEWDRELPPQAELTEISEEQAEQLLAVFRDACLLRGWKETISRSAAKQKMTLEGEIKDKTLERLVEMGLAKYETPRGAYEITCPWVMEHTGGADDGAAYFPPHTHGYANASFKCLHAHCASRTIADLKTYLGVPDEFAQFAAIMGKTPEGGDPFLLTAALENAGAPHYLVEGILRRGDFVALMGLANGGKTAVGLDLSLRLATGLMLLDQRTARCRVLYIASENPDEVLLRIRAWCLENRIEPKELDGWFHIITRNFDLGNDEGAKWLAERMMGYEGDFGCLFVDTFSSNFAGEDENSAAGLMAWINCVRNNLMKPTGCSLIVMHHPPKNSDDVHNWRGSGAVKGALDATWGVMNNGDTVTLEQGKRRGPPFAPMHWKLQKREVPGLEDNFGNPATTVIALPTASAPAGVEAKQANILLCLSEDGEMSNRKIGSRCGLHHPRVAQEIVKMKKDGLLREKEGKKYITPAGREILAIVEKNRPLLFLIKGEKTDDE